MKKTCLIVILLVFVMALFGCPDPKGSEKALRQQVMKEWNAKISKDWEAVYDLTSAEYKGKVDLATFLKGPKIDMGEFSIQEIKIMESGKEAVVNVVSTISHTGIKAPFTFRETWVLEEDGWRLKPAR